MDEVESLSSILGDSPFSPGVKDPAPPADEPKEETETETKAETKDEPKDEPTEPKEDPKEEPKPESDGRNAALKAARERYRTAEARLKELEAKQGEKVSIFEDEDKGIAQRVAEQSRPLREATFNMSVKLARLTYKDEYEKAEAAFFESAEADPRLYEQLRAASDPGEFIFTIGTQISELGPVGGDFMKYRQKVTGELQAQLQQKDEQLKALNARLEALEKAQKELDEVPRSLNADKSAPGPKVEEADEEDISKIVRFKSG